MWRRRKRKLKMVFLLPVIVVETFGLFWWNSISKRTVVVVVSVESELNFDDLGFLFLID